MKTALFAPALFRYYVEINANRITFVAAVLAVVIICVLARDYLQRRKARRNTVPLIRG